MQRPVRSRRGAGVVGDHDDGLAVVGGELAQQVEDAGGGLAVEVTGRFVGDQQGGIRDQRAGDRDALFLAAGQLRRRVVHPVGEADQLERCGHAGVSVFL